MLNSLFRGSTIPVAAQVAQFAEARHAVLAGNVANLGVPGYVGRDLSVDTFQQRLAEALETARSEGQEPSVGRLDDPLDSELRKVRDQSRHILFHDGTDLSMEQQVAALSKNQFMHSTAIAVLQNQMQLLQAAISERV